MRDIREDLRQRLSFVAGQRGEMRARLEWLDRVEEQLRGLLEYERLLQQEVAQESDRPESRYHEEQLLAERMNLSQFLRSALSDAKPHTLDELKREAEKIGFDFAGKNPGRVIHFALLGMAQNGIVQMVERGVWQLATTHSNGSSGGTKVPGLDFSEIAQPQVLP